MNVSDLRRQKPGGTERAFGATVPGKQLLKSRGDLLLPLPRGRGVSYTNFGHRSLYLCARDIVALRSLSYWW